MKRTSTSLLAGALGLGLLLAPTRGAGLAHAGPALSDDHVIADVAELVTPSVVNVSTTTVLAAATSPFGADPFFGGGDDGEEQYGKSLGSGVIVSAKGYVLTNNHVIANARDIKVSNAAGTEWEATVVGADPKSDVAVLKLKGKVSGLKPIAIGDSSKLRLGDLVLAVGNPFGVGQTVTMGIVSAVGRANMGITDYEDFIQTDAAINPGNSGGALVNLKGELVGINTAILSRTGGYQGIGFAIPTDMAKPIMDGIIANGRVVRGWLGVSIQDVTPELADTLKLPTSKGVLITGVVKGSPAAKAGLSRGDVVLSLDGKPVLHAANLRTEIASHGVGKSLKVSFTRGKDTKSTDVALTEQPAEKTADASASKGVATGSLGIKAATLDRALRDKYDLPDELDSGVVVTGVAKGSLADRLGLQAGDVIMELNRVAVKSPTKLAELYKQAGDRLAVLVYRGGATVYLMITK